MKKLRVLQNSCLAELLILLLLNEHYLLIVEGQGTRTVPLDKIHQAFDMLEKWNTWYNTDPEESDQVGSSDPPGPLIQGPVGAKCAENEIDTMRRAYYLRIINSFELGVKSEKNMRDWAIHVAKHLGFYQKKMGNVPLRNNREFCGFESGTNFEVLPTDPQGNAFKWPTDPPLLVCDDVVNKCIRCSEVDAPQRRTLAEACNLMEPEADVLPVPSVGQELYENMKELLFKIMKNPKFGKEYGKPCQASEDQSATFIKIWQTVGVKEGEDPVVREDFEKEWEGIKEVEEKLSEFQEMMKSFGVDDTDDEAYCDPTYKGGYHKVGEDSLACAGKTCKGCRDNPPRREDLDSPILYQTWKYEVGRLHEACKSVNGKLAELVKPKVCPTQPPCIPRPPQPPSPPGKECPRNRYSRSVNATNGTSTGASLFLEVGCVVLITGGFFVAHY